MKNIKRRLSTILVLFSLVGTGCSVINHSKNLLPENQRIASNITIQKNTNEQVEIINQNHPHFLNEDLSLDQGNWQRFSNLDSLNRVGEANAMLHKSMMPTEERERLYIKPTGWKQKKMKNGDYLYNRCHLIGYQMTGENNNPKNLMTGTRSFNTPAMVEYENQVAEYLRRTGNHVRYRVTPDFRENELVARGVQIEAQSIEDIVISFNVYIHNIQEGYDIDYQTGNSKIK
ncbi:MULTISPECIES: DNA/RNA non-specific endonuclease [Enterococcus]|uniref:DNA/RNA non-specific endonuclease n=1 Tax=Enterococcus TaxID=1350 RepID=UPI000CF0BA3E|nr:DNA/RNA non-specific endonuclease [Enterococcus faecium]EGP4846575.1 DNA/RNA non-specific endonuclease [Enterococcus faecium]EGP4892266.1 DNA/RNA non-specific endonuclease [Enterococcus faecium]EGP5343797.1 DNA-entry nuclease [Enterococcus faecium]EGP5672306.1 DNA-entry nuclease [Enterococcus faecium]EGP5699553.1 DNA-entry nuclease [Enterococcus faecium]